MLEYDYDEAEKLLSDNLTGAKRKLVRVSITCVAVAAVHRWCLSWHGVLF